MRRVARPSRSAGEALGAEEHADDEPVDGEQAEGADDAAGDGVVVADDGVLDGVGEREQDDEVEGVELRQLALAEDAQQHHQDQVDDGGASQLLQDGSGS